MNSVPKQQRRPLSSLLSVSSSMDKPLARQGNQVFRIAEIMYDQNIQKKKKKGLKQTFLAFLKSRDTI